MIGFIRCLVIYVQHLESLEILIDFLGRGMKRLLDEL